MYLRPSDIRFSQDSINIYFDKRSCHSRVRIGQTLDDICDGRCRVESLPPISVAKMSNNWVTADNRRLWVFRELERLGKLETIYVRHTYYIPDSKMTSYNNGVSVYVRGMPGGRWYLKPTASKADAKSSRSSSSSYLLNANNIVFGQKMSNVTESQKPVLKLSKSSENSHSVDNSPEVIKKFPNETRVTQSVGTTTYSTATCETKHLAKATSVSDDRDTFNGLPENQSLTESMVCDKDFVAAGNFGKASKYAMQSTNTSDGQESCRSTLDDSTKKTTAADHMVVLNTSSSARAAGQGELTVRDASPTGTYKGKAKTRRPSRKENGRGSQSLTCCTIS